MSISCRCTTNKDGFTNLGVGTDQEWWVHAQCGRPTDGWLREQGDEVLNYFKGGPLDGRAYLTAQLLSRGAMSLPIIEYSWTPDTVTSQKTGATARVWIHKDSATAEQGAAEAVEETASSQGDADAGETPHHGGNTHMSNTGTSLRERRDALKISRPQFAEKLGSTPSKVYRIETDGKRTTDEERAAYAALLDQLEAESGRTVNAEAPLDDLNAPESGALGDPQ